MASTNKGPFHIAFDDGDSGKTWLYIRQLGRGQEGVVQLVKDAKTGELAARKVYRPALRTDKKQTELEDEHEVRIAKIIRRIPLNMPLFEPSHAINMISNNDIPFVDDAGVKHYGRDSYWPLCDGGTTASWFWAPSFGDVVHPPYAFIGGYLRQLYSTVKFLQFASPTPVNHWDLHVKNTYLRCGSLLRDLPDVFVADYGWANDGGPRNPSASTDDANNLIEHIKLLAAVAPERAYQESERHERLLNILSQAVAREKLHVSKHPPPRQDKAFLEKMINLATDLEDRCSAGGLLDETDRKYYKRFVREGHRIAKRTAAEVPFSTGKITAQAALARYGHPEEEDLDAEIHGPWFLYKDGQVLPHHGLGGLELITAVTEGDDRGEDEAADDIGFQRVMGFDAGDDGEGADGDVSRDFYHSDDYDDDGVSIKKKAFVYVPDEDEEEEGEDEGDRHGNGGVVGNEQEEEDGFEDDDDVIPLTAAPTPAKL